MKRLVTTLIVLALLLAVGCTPSSPTDGNTVPSQPGASVSKIGNPPLVGGATFVVAPIYFELGNLYPGAEVSTWTEDGYLDLAGSVMTYSKGDPVCIAIYNGNDHIAAYEIAVENAPLEINQCRTLNKEYHKAPDGFISVVAVSESFPTLSSYEIRTIPFSFVLPVDIDYPEMWEFRIVIAEQGIQVRRAYGVRILITMR